MKLIQELIGINEAEKRLPTSAKEILKLYNKFQEFARSQEYYENAREQEQTLGAEYLVEKFEDWLQNQGYKYAEIEKFMVSYGRDVFEHAYNDLAY